MSADFYRRNAAKYEEFKRRELQCLTLLKKNKPSFDVKKDYVDPFVEKINVHEKRVQGHFEDLLRQLDKLNQSSEDLSFEFEKIKALSKFVVQSASTPFSSVPPVKTDYLKHYRKMSLLDQPLSSHLNDSPASDFLKEAGAFSLSSDLHKPTDHLVKYPHIRNDTFVCEKCNHINSPNSEIQSEHEIINKGFDLDNDISKVSQLHSKHIYDPKPSSHVIHHNGSNPKESSHIAHTTGVNPKQSSHLPQHTKINPDVSGNIIHPIDKTSHKAHPTALNPDESSFITHPKGVCPDESSHITHPTGVSPDESSHIIHPTRLGPDESSHITHPTEVNPAESSHIIHPNTVTTAVGNMKTSDTLQQNVDNQGKILAASNVSHTVKEKNSDVVHKVKEPLKAVDKETLDQQSMESVVNTTVETKTTVPLSLDKDQSKSDDESANHEFDFLDSNVQVGTSRRASRRASLLSKAVEKYTNLKDDYLDSYHESANQNVSTNKDVKIGESRRLSKQPAASKVGLISDNSTLSPGEVPISPSISEDGHSTSLQSEHISDASDSSESAYEAHTSLTATAAYQALLGNVSVIKPNDKKRPVEASDTEDEIENAVVSNVRKPSSVGFRTGDSIKPVQQIEDKRKSVPECKPETETRRSSSIIPSNKPQNKLAKNTRKALGLDTSSGSEVELPSATPKKDDDSDEFDFYD